ncbi:hypothetical protein GCM10009639_14240 [Kitasatospora putterlickiae]|uniref:Uncharacterized protein n=1 Tax=Kitasatospora putterlickiae TaxID=221725 RepID=A0ABN1XRA8_9ACTN
MFSAVVSAVTRGGLRSATRNDSPACTAHAHPVYGAKGGYSENTGSVTSDSHQAGSGRRSAGTRSAACSTPRGRSGMSSVAETAAKTATETTAACGSHLSGPGPPMGGIGCGARVNRSFRAVCSAPRADRLPVLFIRSVLSTSST